GEGVLSVEEARGVAEGLDGFQVLRRGRSIVGHAGKFTSLPCMVVTPLVTVISMQTVTKNFADMGGTLNERFTSSHGEVAWGRMGGGSPVVLLHGTPYLLPGVAGDRRGAERPAHRVPVGHARLRAVREARGAGRLPAPAAGGPPRAPRAPRAGGARGGRARPRRRRRDGRRPARRRARQPARPGRRGRAAPLGQPVLPAGPEALRGAGGASAADARGGGGGLHRGRRAPEPQRRAARGAGPAVDRGGGPG